MTTITATLTVKITGEDADSIALIAESLRTWLAKEGGFQLEAAILDNAPPEYPYPDEDDDGNPTNALLTYEAWTGSGWRLDAAVANVRIKRPPRQGTYLCCVCGENQVFPESGEDTCPDCLRSM